MGSSPGMTNSQIGSSFSALLAAREAQDTALKTTVPTKQYATPSLTQLAASQAIIVKQQEGTHSKQKDIDMILQGDFD